jgi:hypothetical protein
LEHRASNPVFVKNLTAIETSTIVKMLRPYVPVGTRRTRRRRRRLDYIVRPNVLLVRLFYGKVRLG